MKSLPFQIGAVFAVVASCFAWLKLHDRKVVKEERARVEETGKKIDAKAQVARKRAIADPDRVLSKYCRDC
ncbi:MAG: hypothetical protein ABL893_20220 [Hyphomicrobium sp.]